LSQLDLAAIGLPGIWMGCQKHATTGDWELIDDLLDIEWKNRTVYISFDNDRKPAARRDNHHATLRLAGLLMAAGAKVVLIIELPPGPGNTKMGVDDFLMQYDAAAFWELVEQARPVDPELLPEDWALNGDAGRTETANARRLIERFGHLVRWVGPWEKWLYWDGKRWKVDQTVRLQSLGKKIASALWKEFGSLMSEGKCSSDKMQNALKCFIRTSNSAPGVRNMVTLARSEPGVAIEPAELNTHPWFLNVLNGTLDLRTGKLQPHNQDDHLTQLAPVVFDPAATCPLWKKFVKDVLQAGEAGYMQRAVGYSLTGDVREQLLLFLYGIGSNGKTTFIETIKKVLGVDYSMKAAPELLLSKEKEAHPTGRMDLFGMRFVACVETESGRRLNETFVKEATGGDSIRGRKCFENNWEFDATHKLWMAGNYKPIVKGKDYGIWRRIKTIEFGAKFDESNVDKTLPKKLEAELPGILNWAIEGCLAWQQDGMQEPESVRLATESYQREMDTVGQFLEEYCEFIPKAWTSTKGLYSAYQEAFSDPTLSLPEFGKDLSNRKGLGLTRKPGTGNKSGWDGVRLLPGLDAAAKERTNTKVQSELVVKQKTRAKQ
jgi:putative DNA primase/helicase